MLKKIKDILGIEGVRIELLLEESYDIKDGLIKGQLSFSALSDKRVEYIVIKLIEKYKRGRGDSQLVNEYTLGEMQLELNLTIAKDETKTIDFELPYALMKSDMDKLEDRNLASKPFVWLAKKLKNVKSTYRIEAEAFIQGTRLHPLDKKPVILE